MGLALMIGGHQQLSRRQQYKTSLIFYDLIGYQMNFFGLQEGWQILTSTLQIHIKSTLMQHTC